MGKRGCRYTRFSQARTSLIVPSGKYSTRIPATLRLSLQCDRSAPPTVRLIWGGRSSMSAVGGEGVAIEHACEAVNWSGCDPEAEVKGGFARTLAAEGWSVQLD